MSGVAAAKRIVRSPPLRRSANGLARGPLTHAEEPSRFFHKTRNFGRAARVGIHSAELCRSANRESPMAQSYVVVSFAAGETAAFKHFGLWEGAKAFSEDHISGCDRAEIWRVRADDASSAI